MIQNLLHKFTIHFQNWGKCKTNYWFTTFCISLPFTFRSEENKSQINDLKSFQEVYHSFSKEKKMPTKLLIQNLLLKFTIPFQNWRKYKPHWWFRTFCMTLPLNFKREENTSEINDSEPFG